MANYSAHSGLGHCNLPPSPQEKKKVFVEARLLDEAAGVLRVGASC